MAMKKRTLMLSLLMQAALMSVADAASVNISNTPMAIQNVAQSNVLITLDNSGGTDIETSTGLYNSMYYESGVKPGNRSNVLNGNFYAFPAKYRKSNLKVMLSGDLGNPDPLWWRMYSNKFNAQYYDTFRNYQPWTGDDVNGNPFKNADPKSIQYDPYSYTLGTVDITSEMSSGKSVNGWKIPSAHTYLSTSKTDITSSGGRYYSSTWFMPVFYLWVDSNNNGVADVGEGVRYEIKSGTCSSRFANTRIIGCNGLTAYPGGRSYSQEIQNFANWFQYYRTNFLSIQGALGKQVSTLGATRVGFNTLDNPSSSQVKFSVMDMSVAANMSSLQNAIYSTLPNFNDWTQPIHERMNVAKNYFQRTGSSAPIQYACQQNFHLLSTPGNLNETSSNGYRNAIVGLNPNMYSVGDYDSAGGAPGAGQVPYADYGQPGGASYSDTLADWSLSIYNQNLRPDLQKGRVPISAAQHETNSNPHLDLYVISPGSHPALSDSPSFLNPAVNDPYLLQPPIDWPQPFPLDQTSIDDLWHAAVNGRGMFVNGTDADGNLLVVLNDIMGRVGSSASVAVSNANVTPGDNFSYASNYNSGNWSGDLNAYPIDPVSGQPTTTSAWSPSASSQLDSQVFTTGRIIATSSQGVGIPFRWNNLSGTQQSLLNTPISPIGTRDGSNVLNFLRGNRSLEGVNYRVRGHILGDIINAEPVIVRSPLMNYADNGYASFKAQYTSINPRVGMVYQAANDGMLHAFDADTGGESWAYVPGLLFNSRMTAYPNTSTLAGLSFKTNFQHAYMVDSTPASGDADFGNTASRQSNPDWRTMLVGGLGKGGRGYYALDITDPVNANEAALAKKVLWEFPKSNTSNPNNIGFSYGTPVIAKTSATGWVVLVASGLNNGTNAGDSGGDGMGHLYVLDARTGDVIRDIKTGSGSSSSPSGLSHLSAWVNNPMTDPTVSYVYGGDLNGNVWRFDLTSSNPSSWFVTKVASLVDNQGNAQPITTMPELAMVNGKRMIYVGTGQYLSSNDVNTTSTQSMYGLMDDVTVKNGTVINPLRSSLQGQTISTSGGQLNITNNAVSAGKQGWYADFPARGERMITSPTLANTTLVFTTIIPSSADPCSPGGSSVMYTLNYQNGGSAPGVGSLLAGITLGNVLSSRPVLVRLPSGAVKGLVRTSDAKTVTVDVPTQSAANTPRRVSWREILR